MCKTLNNSYLIIGLTGIVLLSLIGVGVFLVLNQETKNSATGIQSTNKSESNTVPTKNDKTIAQTSVVVSLLPQNSVSGTQINKPSENKNIVINVNNQLNGTGIQSTKKPTNTNKNTTSTSVHLNVSVLLGHKNGSKIQPSSERGNKSVVKQGNRTTTQFGVHSGVTNIRDQYNGTRNQTIRTQVPSVGHGPLAKNQTSGMGRPFIEGNRTTTQFGVHSGVTNIRPQYNGTRNQTIKTQAPFLGPGPQPKNQTFRTEKPFIGRNRTQVDTGHSGGQRKYPNGIGQYVPRPPIKPPTFTPYDNRHLSQVPQGGGQSKYPTGIGQYTPKFPIKPPTFTPYNNRHGSQVPQRGGERTYTTHNGQRGSKRRY